MRRVDCQQGRQGMKRTAFLRKPATTARLTVPVFREKKCKTKSCEWRFTPTRKIQPYCTACEYVSAMRYVGKKAEERAAIERKADRAKKEKLKTISAIEEECRRIVQKIACIRDRNDGCISCDLPATWDGQWHGSHFRSHGACSALQFHLWNINKACWICNKLYSGRIDQYEPRLVAKIGQARVDWLKAQNQVVKSERAYLAKFKRVMGKRLRRMEKRNG